MSTNNNNELILKLLKEALEANAQQPELEKKSEPRRRKHSAGFNIFVSLLIIGAIWFFVHAMS